jgi:hypothetical protein
MIGMYGLSDLDLARELNRERVAFADIRRARAVARAERRRSRTRTTVQVAKASSPRVAPAGPVGCTA